MKHIKKKFRYENSDFFEGIKNSKKSKIHNLDNPIDRKDVKDNFVLMKHNSGKEILSFPLDYNKKVLLVPIPDYPLMYYNHAYLIVPVLTKSKNELIKALQSRIEDRALCDTEIYNYFGYLSSFILNLYCSLESYVNRCLANKAVKLKFKGNMFEIEDPQKSSSLFDKIKYIIPQIFNDKKSFRVEYIQDYQFISDLHKLRDNLAHTKTDNQFYKDYEIDLFKDLISFNHVGALIAVRKFVNHYTPGYMEDCDCEKDF